MKKTNNTRGNFYRKSLLVILLVTSIPGLITALSIYWFAVSAIEQDLKVLHSKQMEQRVQTVDEMFSYFEGGLANWAFDPRFDHDLLDIDFAVRFKETQELAKTLRIIQNSHPMIERVNLFIQRPNENILFSPDYNLLTNAKLQSEYEKMLNQSKQLIWTTQPIVLRGASQEGPTKTEPVITLSHKIPGGSRNPFGVLTLSLHPSQLLDLLLTLTPYNEGTTFLMNDHNKIIVSNHHGAEAEVFERALREDITKAGQPSGSYVKNWRGTTYSVSYGTFDRLDQQWTYVAAAPMSVITSPVIIASKIIFIISALVLLAALILSWLASRQIYTPIERLIQLLTGGKAPELYRHGMDEFKLLEKEWQHLTRESKTLQLRLEEELPHVKEGFLMQLIQGHLHAYSEKDLRERMKHYGWRVSDQQFTMVSVQLTGLANVPDRFLSGDEGLVTFAAANIIEELAAERFQQYNILNFHDLSIGLLVIAPMEEPQHAKIRNLAEALTEAINNLIKLNVTITISRPTMLVSSLPGLFLDVTQATSYRLFKDENQIIDMEELHADVRDSGGEYPFALDREIIQALRMGEPHTVETLIDQFLEEVSAEQGKEYLVQQSALQLFGSIQYTILQSGMQPHLLFKGVNMFDRLSQIREAKQLAQWFKQEVVHPYMNELENRSNMQLKQVVERTIQHMHTHYMDDISLDSCAMLVETTTYTLSRAFKQMVGMNFVDYLTQYRVDKAKELLRTTDLRINDIAEQVGYQHSYFNRIFKRYEGLTPSQYRDKWAAN